MYVAAAALQCLLWANRAEGCNTAAAVMVPTSSNKRGGRRCQGVSPTYIYNTLNQGMCNFNQQDPLLPNNICCMICAFTCCNKDLGALLTFLLTGTCCSLTWQSCQSTPSVQTFRQIIWRYLVCSWHPSHKRTCKFLLCTTFGVWVGL